MASSNRIEIQAGTWLGDATPTPAGKEVGRMAPEEALGAASHRRPAAAPRSPGGRPAAAALVAADGSKFRNGAREAGFDEAIDLGRGAHRRSAQRD